MRGPGPATVELLVPGEPVPWARARRKGNRYYTDPKVAEFQERVRTAWMVEGKPTGGDAWLDVELEFYLSRPPSHLTTKGNVRKGAPKFPSCDIDNLAKGVLDALNGHAFVDDRQVIMLAASKWYAREGEARTDIWVEGIG